MPLYEASIKIPNTYDSPGLETEPFAKCLPQTNPQPLDKPDESSLTLNELLSSVQKTIAEKHPTRYWVRAEIVNLSKNVHLS